MKRYTIGFLMLLMIVGMTSCRGTTGPAGFDGRNGQNGRDGQDGKDGASSVRSIYYVVKENGWEASKEKGRWFVELNVGELSPEIVEFGTVIVYRETPLKSWESLPITMVRIDGDKQYMQELWYSFLKGGVDIDWFDSQPSPKAPAGDMKFKVVLLNGTALSKIKGIDKNDYEKVSKILNLEDKPSQYIEIK